MDNAQDPGRSAAAAGKWRSYLLLPAHHAALQLVAILVSCVGDI